MPGRYMNADLNTLITPDGQYGVAKIGVLSVLEHYSTEGELGSILHLEQYRHPSMWTWIGSDDTLWGSFAMISQYEWKMTRLQRFIHTLRVLRNMLRGVRPLFLKFGGLMKNNKEQM
jgi:hypothetical protein